MNVLRFLSKTLGFFCLSLSLFLIFVILFYFHLIATIPTLADSLPGNASVFIDEHNEESLAFVQESFEMGDVCIQDPSQDVCVMLSNTTFLSEQFSELIPTETFDLESYPQFQVIQGYVKHLAFVALVLFALGLVFVFLGYQPMYSSFFQALSFFFFSEFLLYSLGVFLFLGLTAEYLTSLVQSYFSDVSPFLILFVVSLVLPYLQSLTYDFLFPLIFLAGGFLGLFLVMFIYKKKKKVILQASLEALPKAPKVDQK